MDARHFNELVRNFTQVNAGELSELKNLSQAFPYSQLIHALNARAARDQHDPEESSLLHESAVYATDRSVLKWAMTLPVKERQTILKKEEVVVEVSQPITPEVVPMIIKEVIEESKKVEQTIQVPMAEVPTAPVAGINTLTGDALREDLLMELNRLQKLKHNFEESVDAFHKIHPIDPVSDVGARKRRSKGPSEPVGEALLEEIKSSKKKVNPESPRQKEQNEIIEQFIKEKPSLPKAKPGEPAKDLAEDSSAFSDNIISETLVGILLKQGKKDKAVEVLKKLIWKFPQKKAYFAAQIEQLKN